MWKGVRGTEGKGGEEEGTWRGKKGRETEGVREEVRGGESEGNRGWSEGKRGERKGQVLFTGAIRVKFLSACVLKVIPELT